MKNTYHDLIQQSYYFPQDGFDLQNGYLTFHGVSLKYLIEKYGTPFRLMYLPSIGEKIRKAKNLFQRAMRRHRYSGNYHYCYCTKCCHFYHVINTALREGVHIETSSSFDIDLIRKLAAEGKVNKSHIFVHNGYKTEGYIDKMIALQRDGFKNAIIVLDSTHELDRIIRRADGFRVKIGIRMAIDEEPQASYYTSRLGIRASEVLSFFREKIRDNPAVQLKMFHFFVDSGIRDTLYYWDQFHQALAMYATIKKESADLKAFNLGGGFPIRNNLGFSFDYEGMIDQIVDRVKRACTED
ncbi:MAG: arginine decarboxylase, partial [Saprospiraceae bacterium]|nr:arginine decarboxylase [Saprospiraceae bacterium]